MIKKPQTSLSPNLHGDRTAHLVRHLNRAFQAALEGRLDQHGVSFGSWTYLRVLWEEDGISQIELSKRVGLSGPTTNSIIKRMQTAGLVAMIPLVDGKPRAAVHLTDKGRALRTVLEPLAEEVNALAVTGIAADDMFRVRQVMLAMLKNLS